MRIRLLGPVEVCLDGRTRAVPGLRRKAVLAALALRPGEIVSTDWLIDVVWGDRAPTNAVNTLQRHLSYLRQTLESRSAILSSARGYVLDLAGDSTDVEIAEDLIGQASRAAEPRQRVQGVRTALGLWRGRSLGDVTGVAWLEAQARRLDQLRLQATRVLIDTRLRLGEHTELLPELERLILDHPFDEQLHAQLILSLYRTGRQADALAAYQRLRRRLGDELGIEPGPALRDLEVAILRQDPGLDPAPSAVLPPAAVRPDTSTVPAQLPSTTRDFTGRRKQVAELDALLSAGLAEPAAATICAISGTAGVGKTALAMHWANQVADRFPDGQLYLNLRGFDPGAPALEPTAAIRTLLEAFGVPAEGLPASLDALTARYRTMLDGRRVLVLLDNARDVEQVRPLLPGKPGCLAIVTSRNRLTSLVAAEGAYPLAVDLLTNQEARQLLISRLGVDRVTAEAAAIDQIIALTARLPLALAIVAARAATHPGFPLTRLAAELQDSRRRLDVLDTGDPATDIRAVFAWSYDALTPDAGRLFRILGLHPGPDLSTTAAASLAGIPADQVRPLLDELAQVHLVEEHLPGRYTQHDLLRTYATELAHAAESDARRQSAVHRLLDHYLHTAYPADRLMDPHRDPLTLAPPQPGVILEPPADYEQASAWLTAEHPVLLGAVHLAATNGLHTHTWQLAWSLRTYLNRRGHWYDWITIAGTAVTAADQLDDPCAQAVTHRLLGRGHFQLGRFTEAHAHLQRALDLYRRTGDLTGQAYTHHDLALAWGRQDGPHVTRDHTVTALDHSRQALALHRTAGHRAGQASALNSIGWYHALFGNYSAAIAACQQALALFQDLSDPDGQAATWDSLGYAYDRLGRYSQAVDCYRHALHLNRDLGHRYCEAEVLAHLGDTHYTGSHVDAARAAWQQALTILSDLNHPDAEEVRTKLAGLDAHSMDLGSLPVRNLAAATGPAT